MRKLTIPVLSLLLLFSATTALAQIDVEVAFSPTEVSIGDEVTFFAAVINLGDTEVLAQIDLTIESGGLFVGPLTGFLPLAAGQELSTEFTFTVPPLTPNGNLTITVTATAGEYSDTATATLTVVAEGETEADDQDLLDIGTAILSGFQDVLPVEEMTLGRVKDLFR
jgi:uncharacterized membrane protein